MRWIYVCQGKSAAGGGRRRPKRGGSRGHRSPAPPEGGGRTWGCGAEARALVAGLSAGPGAACDPRSGVWGPGGGVGRSALSVIGQGAGAVDRAASIRAGLGDRRGPGSIRGRGDRGRRWMLCGARGLADCGLSAVGGSGSGYAAVPAGRAWQGWANAFARWAECRRRGSLRTVRGGRAGDGRTCVRKHSSPGAGPRAGAGAGAHSLARRAAAGRERGRAALDTASGYWAALWAAEGLTRPRTAPIRFGVLGRPAGR